VGDRGRDLARPAAVVPARPGQALALARRQGARPGPRTAAAACRKRARLDSVAQSPGQSPSGSPRTNSRAWPPSQPALVGPQRACPQPARLLGGRPTCKARAWAEARAGGSLTRARVRRRAGHPAPHQPGLHVRRGVPRCLRAHHPDLLGQPRWSRARSGCHGRARRPCCMRTSGREVWLGAAVRCWQDARCRRCRCIRQRSQQAQAGTARRWRSLLFAAAQPGRTHAMVASGQAGERAGASC